MRNKQELLSLFFSRELEKAFNDKILDDVDYLVPLDNLLNYCRELLAIPISDFLYFILDKDFTPINPSFITQCSSFEDSEVNMITGMLSEDNRGMDFVEIGVMLSSNPNGTKAGAFRKYGENQVKTAAQLGLTFEYYEYWYLNCISYVYMQLSENERIHLLARNLLRDPFYSIIATDLAMGDVCLNDYLTCISDSTIIRRISNVKRLVDIIITACEQEGTFLNKYTYNKITRHRKGKVFPKSSEYQQTPSLSLKLPPQPESHCYEGDVFYLNWDGIEAKALFRDGKVIMLKGSQIRKLTVPSAHPERRKLLLEDLCEEVSGKLILREDTVFKSPSRAAWIASGTGLNGWDWWKNLEGKTLDQVFRPNTDSIQRQDNG